MPKPPEKRRGPEPRLESERDGYVGYARALSKITEVVSPIWDMIQWSAVPIWKLLGGFLLVGMAVFLYAAAQGPWLCIWLNAVANVLGLSVC
jgi:hypothetical protein